MGAINSSDIAFLRDMVCLRNTCINTLHRGDSDDDYMITIIMMMIIIIIMCLTITTTTVTAAPKRTCTKVN
jgi:hypothetical protein